MAGVIDHPLKPITDDILARAIPEDERENLKSLLDSTVLYIKRVETGALSPQERTYPSHKDLRFLEIALSRELANSLKDRIRIIHEYDIRSIPRIREIMSVGMVRTPHRIFTPIEINLLKELAETPIASISQLARRTDCTRYRVSQLLQRFEEKNGLRRLYSENRGKLKLTTYSCVFRTQSFEESIALQNWVRKEQPPFLVAATFDVTYTQGFLVFAIPSQQRAHQLIEKRFRWLRKNFFRYHHIHKVNETFWNIRFDLYDTKLGQWHIPPELKEIKRIDDPGESGIAEIPHKYYKDLRTAVQFTQIDFFLANLGISSHHVLKDITELAKNHGLAFSKNTIWLHLKRLKEDNIITPMMYFSGGGFEEFVLLSILCDLPTRRRLQLMASWFPAAFTYPSDEGISIFIKNPIGWRDTLLTFTQEISQAYGIDDLIVVHQERNIGSSLDSDFYRRWNENRQYWEFSDEEI
jgi:DNA-binding MarR family transcriptional regulator